MRYGHSKRDWRRNRPIERLREDLVDMVHRARQAEMEVVIAGCFGSRDYDCCYVPNIPPRQNFAINRKFQNLLVAMEYFHLAILADKISQNGFPYAGFGSDIVPLSFPDDSTCHYTHNGLA